MAMSILCPPTSPLEVPELLCEIIARCDEETVKSVRLVNRYWSAESLPHWRAIAPATFVTFQGRRNLENFIQDKKIWLDRHPYRIYVLRSRIPPVIRQECIKFIKVMKLSWIQFRSDADCRTFIFGSPVLEVLDLNGISVPGHFYPWSSIPDEPLKASPVYGIKPNMKTLRITNCFARYGFIGIGRTPGVSWMELLVHFPNLKELDLKDHETTNMEEIRMSTNMNGVRMQRLLLALQRLGNAAPKLDSLALPGMPNEHHFQNLGLYLGQQGTELSKLRIKTPLFESDENTFLRTVKSTHGQKMKTLHLYICRRDRMFSPDLSGFGRLQELAINGEFLTSLACLNWLPQLVSLKLEIGGVIRRTNCEEIILQHLKNLELMRCADEGNLDAVFKMFPNIRKLKVDKWIPGFFQKVCECWKDLVQITSGLKCGLSNGAVTGLTRLQMRSICADSELSLEEMKAKAFTSDKPNITMLKSLRYFLIEEDDFRVKKYSRNFIMDNCSALYGFLKLPNLYHLRVAKAKLSPEVDEELKKAIVCVEIGKKKN